MPTKISSREVLAYLNGLGYSNVNAQQLKEFIQDLKKLIKHEERRRSEEHVSSSMFSEARGKSQSEIIEEEYSDIFSALHSQGTVASKAKAVPKKESVISVQIKRSKPQIHCGEHNNGNVIEKTKYGNGRGEAKSAEDINRDVDKEPVKLHSVSEGGDDKKMESKKLKTSKPTTSFIRPKIQMSNKSDPVALYHQYQAIWKRKKVPGEDNRTDLRWAIRERMSRGPT